jgi:hypothetical protein
MFWAGRVAGQRGVRMEVMGLGWEYGIGFRDVTIISSIWSVSAQDPGRLS